MHSNHGTQQLECTAAKRKPCRRDAQAPRLSAFSLCNIHSGATMKTLFRPSLAALATALALSACSHTPHQPPQPKAQAAMPSTHTVVSRYSFNDTVSRLENAITSRGMTVFAVIDHQATARQSGLNMQPAKVIIFGTPKAGTPLMAKDPAFALQLPLRVLVTENSGQVQVVFNDTRALISGSNIGYAEVENTLAGAEKLIRHTVSE